METLDPKLVDEVKRRVCIARTMALTIKPDASKEEQRQLAAELLDGNTTEQLIQKILVLRWNTPQWWKGTREQWLRHIGPEEGKEWTSRN